MLREKKSPRCSGAAIPPENEGVMGGNSVPVSFRRKMAFFQTTGPVLRLEAHCAPDICNLFTNLLNFVTRVRFMIFE